MREFISTLQSSALTCLCLILSASHVPRPGPASHPISSVPACLSSSSPLPLPFLFPSSSSLSPSSLFPSSLFLSSLFPARCARDGAYHALRVMRASMMAMMSSHVAACRSHAPRGRLCGQHVLDGEGSPTHKGGGIARCGRINGRYFYHKHEAGTP